MCFIFQIVTCGGGVLCFLGEQRLKGDGNNIQMMVEKGEDIKQSADQSSPRFKEGRRLRFKFASFHAATIYPNHWVYPRPL